MKTALRLRARAFAFLCRRSTVAALMVLSYLGAMIGYPHWEPVLGKDQSQAYPCQFSSCGCRTAEQCRQSCCCHTKKEKVAWALKRNIDPHRVAVLTTSELNQFVTEILSSGDAPVVAAKTCCSQKKVAEEAPVKSCCQKKASTPKLQFTFGIKAMQCRGNATTWIQTGMVALAPPSITLVFQPHLITSEALPLPHYLSPTLGQLLRPA